MINMHMDAIMSISFSVFWMCERFTDTIIRTQKVRLMVGQKMRLKIFDNADNLQLVI